MILAVCWLVNSFFLKLIIPVSCSLKDSQTFFMQFLPLDTSCLVSMLLNDDIVDIVKLDGICSPTFVVDELSGLFLNPSVFSVKHWRSV